MRPDPYAWSPLADEAVVLVPALLLAYAVAARAERTDRRRVVLFAAGAALIVVVFVTPLQALSLHYLLTAHLLQNVALAEWAPALCIAGLPPVAAARLARLPEIRLLTRPIVALPVWVATYLIWHIPVIYDAALEHPAWLLHLEHLSYLVAGGLLWWPVFQDVPHRMSSGAKAIYLFLAFVLASPLGLLLGLLPQVVYDFYGRAPRIWGLSHIGDQQLAGITMVSEQALVFFAVSVAFLTRHLREEEAREQFRSFVS